MRVALPIRVVAARKVPRARTHTVLPLADFTYVVQRRRPPAYSTSLFPDVIGQTFDRWREFQTIRNTQDTAADQGRAMGGSNIVWAFKLGWTALLLADAQALLHTFEFMGGETLPLLFFEWIPRSFTGVLIGTGTGAQTAFDAPVKASAAGTTTVRVNGTPTGITFQSSSGTNGEDRYVFGAAPANGAIIRAHFTGRRRRNVRLRDRGSFKLGVRPRSAPILWHGEAMLVEPASSDT